MNTLPATHAPATRRSAGLTALRALSISHRTAPIADLERLAFPPGSLADLHARFRAEGLQAIVLSTCGRTELYSYATGPDGHARAETLLLAAAAAAGGRMAGATAGQALDRRLCTEVSGLEAAAHLFRVAAGLESLVLGEAEVLGQVRAALEGAERAGAAGFFLAALFRAAVRFGGRVRSETGIGSGALSVASAAVRLLARVHRDLSACTVLVAGTGATGLKAARHLRSERVGRLVLANRTRRRAEEAAGPLGAEVIALEEVPRLLARFDAVLTAAQVERPLLTAGVVRAARGDARDPLVLIDVSLPRAIDPACAGVPGVILHDLSGLEQVVAHNRAQREREIPRVASLLEQELRLFVAQARESTARPLVAELWQRAEAIRREEVERALGEGLRDGALLERATRRIVDRLLHAPSAALRRDDLMLDEQHARYLRCVLGLDREERDAPR